MGVVEPVGVVVPEAVTVPAPEAVEEFSVTDATPLESVSAVPAAGSNVPSVVSVVNVMTAPDIGAPLSFLNVALTLAEFPNEMDVRVVVLFNSVSAIVRVGTPLSKVEVNETVLV